MIAARQWYTLAKYVYNHEEQLHLHYKVQLMYTSPTSSVADPHRKNADADPGKNLNADAVADQDADSCPYRTMASQVIV